MENILNIINSSHEPVYSLEKYLKSLNKEERSSNLNFIKNLAVNGSAKERFVSLAIIDWFKPSFVEKLSEELIKEETFELVSTDILTKVISICCLVNKKVQIDYAYKIIKYSRDKDSYLYIVGIRNFILTDFWEYIIPELINVILNYRDIDVIDLIAFFKVKRTVKDFEILLDHLDENQINYIKRKNLSITKRMKNYT